MDDLTPEEIDDLLAVESELRDFVKYYDQQSEASKVRGSEQKTFAPRTVEMVEKVRPALARLDAERQKRAA